MNSQPNRASFLAAGLLLGALTPAVGLGQAPAHDPASLATLTSLSDKASLSADELALARAAMLKVNNEARLNPEYRRLKKLKQDLNLPAGLSPLVLDDTLNAAAQVQAESKAGVRTLPRGASMPGPMASGTSRSLADFPVGWQSSESTYRPTWDIGGKVDSVGFGVAKNARTGDWSVVAIWADLGGAAVKDSGLHDPANVRALTALNDKTSLTAEEMKGLREAMLRLNNEARANPEYRKKSGSKQDLNLPTGLPPLVLDDAANKAAQVQADYQASIDTMTHDNRNYPGSDGGYDARMRATGVTGGLEACGYSTSLADFPIGWMKSDTHYRPTWDISDPVRRVGYGVAKNARSGRWYATAIWLPADAKEATAAAGATAGATAGAREKPAERQRVRLDQPPVGYEKRGVRPNVKTVDGKEPKGLTWWQVGSELESTLEKGGVMFIGERLSNHEGRYRLSIDFAGKLVLTDPQGNVTWSAGEGGTHLEFQANDGNVCLYDDQKNWKWGTQTYGPDKVDGSLRVTEEGVLQQLDKDGKVVWSSK